METHYYLINGTVKKGGEMPIQHLANIYADWYLSLQPCEISESELEKICEYLNRKFGINYDEIQNGNPIDVTDIVEEKSIRELENRYKNQSSGTVGFAADYIYKDYIFFKQPIERQKQVDGEIEAVAGYVAFNVNGIISGIYSNLEWLKEDYPKSGYYKLTTLRNI